MNHKLTALATGAFLTSFALAGTYTFTPSNSDLSNLDHYSYYTWGIGFNVPQGETITGASLTIKNIYDWTVEDGDMLYVHLLDNPALGVTTFVDNQGGGDNFAGQGMLIGTWSDPAGGKATGFDLTMNLNAQGVALLNKYAADGKFGFGFDPDCHYFNDGVSVTVKTAPVPEPASLATLAIGGAALIRRRRQKKA